MNSIFFFSSRRRHSRCYRDWSSDVCSSDLDKLPEPIFTPSTKAAVGHHDENISFERAGEILGQDIAGKVKSATLAIYKDCAQYALTRGIIIADTKVEFGLDENGALTLIHEVLTPDSARFWPAA